MPSWAMRPESYAVSTDPSSKTTEWRGLFNAAAEGAGMTFVQVL